MLRRAETRAVNSTFWVVTAPFSIVFANATAFWITPGNVSSPCRMCQDHGKPWRLIEQQYLFIYCKRTSGEDGRERLSGSSHVRSSASVFCSRGFGFVSQHDTTGSKSLSNWLKGMAYLPHRQQEKKAQSRPREKRRSRWRNRGFRAWAGPPSPGSVLLHALSFSAASLSKATGIYFMITRSLYDHSRFRRTTLRPDALLLAFR